MKRFPAVDLSFEELYRLILAPVKSRLLLTGIELKVFDRLREPRSSGDLAEDLGAHPGNTRLFLDGLAAFDLLVKKDGLYCNSPLAQTFLMEGSPTFLGGYLAMESQYQERVLDDLTTFVLKGPVQNAGFGEDSEVDLDQRVFAMASYERSGMAQLVVKIVEELPEYPAFQKMLDLGGGPGLIGMAVVVSHPTMRGVVFDLPPVVKVAERFIREGGMEDRMEVMAGDFLSDRIGDDYDLVLACASLYSSKGDLDSMMKKIQEALNPGGVFVSLHEGLTQEMTKPETMRLGWLPSGLMGKDLAFEQGAIAGSMLRAGFKSVLSRTLGTPLGPLDLDVGRKP